MNRRLAGWIAVVAAYQLVDVLAWLPGYVEMAGSWQRGLLQSVASSLPWVLIGVAAYLLTVRFPIGRKRLVAFAAVHAGGFGAAMLAFTLWTVAANGVVGWHAELPGLWALFQRILLMNVKFPFYLLVLGAAHAYHYAWLHREREIQLAKARTQLARAELDALRAQIQPHFLFNVLNTISSFVLDDPRRARVMIARLGDLLRSSLDGDGRLEVPLRDDLKVLRAYLEIEEARFEDRLSVSWDVHPDSLEVLVPPLVLQPLAENAIRHGLSPRVAPGELRISAHPRDGLLHLLVEDDGIGLPEGCVPRTGVGLANVRARLTQLYGDTHHFTVRPRPDGGVVAALAVPLRTERSADPSRSRRPPARAVQEGRTL